MQDSDKRPRWLMLDADALKYLSDTLSADAFAAYIHCCSWAAQYGVTEFGVRARTHFTRRRWTVERELFDAGLWVIELGNIRIEHPEGGPVIRRLATSNLTPRARRSLSPRTRYGILERDNFRCRACGASVADEGITLHIDHKIAVANGGTSDPDNLQTLCSDCNLGKADR